MENGKQDRRPDTSKNGLLKKFPRTSKDPSRANRTNQIMSKLKSTDENMNQN